MWYVRTRTFVLTILLKSIRAKDPELPLCPTNMEYFPQNLPMHCRLPGTIPPFPPQIYQNPTLGKQPLPIPMPIPGIPGPLPGSIPGPMPLPMLPMPQAPAHKLPVIVMPFYSPDSSVKHPHSSHQGRLVKKRKIVGKKRRPKHRYNSEEDDSEDTDSSTDDSSNVSSEHGWWKGRRDGRRSSSHHKSKRKKNQSKDILTPILQYVTKDGYVIFEKQISKGEAKDWLVSKDEKKNTVDAMPSKKDHSRDSSEDRDKGGTRVSLKKDVEEIEVKTEMNLRQMQKKKNFKRKPIKKHIEE